MATNSLDSTSGYWTIHCKHDACQGRHKTAFLGEMIERGWFEESVLYDPAFILAAEDDVIEPERGAAGAGAKKGPPPTDDLIAALSDQCSEADIRALYKRLMRREPDVVERIRIDKKVQKKTGLGLRPLAKFWKDLEAAKVSQERAASGADLICNRYGDFDFDKVMEYVHHQIASINAESPRIFDMGGRIAVVRHDADDNAEAVPLNQGQRAFVLYETVRFEKQVSDTKFVNVPADREVIGHTFNSEYRDWLPALSAVKTTPFFAKDGALVENVGYHAGSQTYLSQPRDLDWGRVSASPSDDEVADAIFEIGSEVLGDFPLGGGSRTQIETILARIPQVNL